MRFLPSHAVTPSGDEQKGARLQGCRPCLDSSRCTGCGLCAVDCPTRALTLLEKGTEGVYQLLFRHDLCTACGSCEKTCPESCLHLERGLELERRGKAARVLFEDKISRCRGCGSPLFPQAMIKSLKTKLLSTGGPSLLFDLCPACRLRTQFLQEKDKKQDNKHVSL
jgi:ferredoxin